MVVKQIANLFQLMELFAREQKPLSVREIVSEFGWPRSSVFNTVSTLVDLGYVYQPQPRGGYFPTSKWADLANAFGVTQPWPESVHQLLESLSQDTGETAFLTIAEGRSVVFVDVVESSADIRFIANIGQRLPIHVTAAGRAILSLEDEQDRYEVLKGIQYKKYEKDTFMSADSVESDIQDSLAKGYFVNLGIYAPGVAGLAVPFCLDGRKAAIALGGPVARIEPRLLELGDYLQAKVEQFFRLNK